MNCHSLFSSLLNALLRCVFCKRLFIKDLSNNNVKEINLTSDLTLENIGLININGENKVIKGNSHTINIVGQAQIIANNNISEISNLTITSTNQITLEFKYKSNIKLLKPCRYFLICQVRIIR